MSNHQSVLKVLGGSALSALVLSAGLLTSTAASAQANVSLNIGGVLAPGVYGNIAVGQPVPVHYRRPPQVIYSAPPVMVAPPPVYYQQPQVVYQQPPVYYAQPQVIVRPPVVVTPNYYGYSGYGYGYRHHHGHHHHHRGRY